MNEMIFEPQGSQFDPEAGDVLAPDQMVPLRSALLDRLGGLSVSERLNLAISDASSRRWLPMLIVTSAEG